METTKTVSVIVPIFNVDIYLRKCLDSLAAQSLEGLEVILVNDGSTDYSADIAREYAEKYPERFIYVEETNSGLSAARNYGFSFSKGEYIAYVDSDDYVAPDIYRLMYEKAIEDDSDLVCCGYDRIRSPWDDPDAAKTVKQYRFYAMHHSGHSVYDYPSLLIESSCYAWNKLYRRSLMEKTAFPAGQKYEDSAVTYNLMEMANRISLVNEAGYYYRVQRAGAITTETRGIFDIFKSMDSLLAYYRGIGKEKTFHDELEYLCFRHLLYARQTQLARAPLSVLHEYLSKAFRYLSRNFPGWRNNKYYLRDSTLYSPKYEAKKIFYFSSYSYITCNLMSRVSSGIKKGIREVKRSFSPNADNANNANNKKKSGTASLDPEVLQEIQSLQRGILKTIHNFCRDNGLRYYAAEGSLLGAVRHNGFVPWDDDMDLVMPRDDFEQLISLWSNRSIAGCVLLSKETYGNYYLPFIKIVQNENIKYYTRNRKTPAFFQGLSIDVFPLDAAVECDTKEEIRRLRKIRMLRDMMLYKVDSLKSGARRFASLLHGAPFRSMKSLQEQLKSTCTKYNHQDTPCLANYGSAYSPMRETFPRELWGEPKLCRFDDTEIMVPQEGERILNCIYGAYNELPPEEQQVCKHKYEKVITDDETQVS